MKSLKVCKSTVSLYISNVFNSIEKLCIKEGIKIYCVIGFTFEGSFIQEGRFCNIEKENPEHYNDKIIFKNACQNIINNYSTPINNVNNDGAFIFDDPFYISVSGSCGANNKMVAEEITKKLKLLF